MAPAGSRSGAAARAGAVLLALAVGAPMAWAVWGALAAGADPGAWRALEAQPLAAPAWLASLVTGAAATALSVALSAWILSRSFPGPHWDRIVRRLAPLLATPHAAFAIGLAFLVAPSGWLLRALSPWATGFEVPPPWLTTQDPWGLGLVAVLVAKEVPFLLWTAAAQLQRADTGRRLARELDVARSLGYGTTRAWWRIVWPQLAPRLRGPALAVLAYSLTVVDMALVIGPAAPPTLSVLAWQWLLDADPATNAMGAAAAWALAVTVAAVACLAWMLMAGLHRWRPAPAGHRGGTRLRGHAAFTALLVLYAAVLAALALGSFAGVWPFPRLVPERWSLAAWVSVMSSSGTLVTTVQLALLSAAGALVWALAWLELAPASWDAAARRLLYLPLVLPPVVWVLGLHRLAVTMGWDGRWPGLWLAHVLAALPYAVIALAPAYRGFDQRYGNIAASLGHGRLAFLLRVKWPLLRAALAGSFAVAFAVSVAQYLPTLFVGAGRFATVTTEAVTLAAGAQRSLTAAYAWLQWLLPVLAFAAAAWVGRPRRFRRRA